MNVGCPSCRHVLSLVGFFVYVSFFTLRVNLSVAIIVMVNSTYLRELEAAAVVNVSNNTSTHDDDDDDDGVRVFLASGSPITICFWIFMFYITVL